MSSKNLVSVFSPKPARQYPVEFIGIGAYVPPNRLTTQELLTLEFPDLHMTPEKIERVLGSHLHPIAEPNESRAQMMVKASRQALEEAGIDPLEIDLIIATPMPPDAVTPPAGAVVQHELQAWNARSWDLNMACSSSIAALEVAANFIATGTFDTILITAATVMSRENGIWQNPMHRFIFGDASGAMIVRRARLGQKMTLKTRVLARGVNHECIHYPAPGSLKPSIAPEGWRGFFMGDKDLLFHIMDTDVRSFVNEFWLESGCLPEEVTRAVVHQPTRDLFLRSVDVSRIPIEKIHQNYAQVGNIIAAELEVALADWRNYLRPGQQERIYGLIYGAGITLGAMLYEP